MTAGGTLVVTRWVKLANDFRRRFEDLGFAGVTVTCEEKDSLNTVINEVRPGRVIIGSGFYKSATPYMMGRLLRRFPKLDIAAVSISEYPDDLAACFIFRGVKSYVNLYEGEDEFRRGLDEVKTGKHYISPGVIESIQKQSEMPQTTNGITEKQIEIIRLVCSGFTGEEIGDTLHICRSTVEKQKKMIYDNLHVRNERELIRTADCLGIAPNKDVFFYGTRFHLGTDSKED